MTYGTLCIGLVLVNLPAGVLSGAGIVPTAIGGWHVAGVIVGLAGAVLAVSCILTWRSSARALQPRSIRLAGS